MFSLVVNHLATRESFPGSEQYRFPIEGFLYSMALCILIGTIAELNFNYYKKKYFATKVEVVTISRFMLTTLGYVTLLYVPLSIVVDSIVGGETAFYYLLIGLLITLLLSFILIGLAYAQDIYYLYKHSIKDAEITIESGVKTTKITYENIACFYSENKVVYTVQNDGSTLSTNFTLNELEEKINDQLFFRANRQMIIHKEAVGQVEKIQNGKLRVRLKLPVGKHIIDPITISRYKRQAFINWFQ
ncbi:LytR/AlgR family response regulator transcription factor [Altibacter sp. HG106]|uniref:LytR/AlgR family response regulator transcription factor n=1 Tax=Altibacter sp. HG106 TaxID=3023937 RepID=UPI00234FE6BC|nr:LytTR family DNA-binding domain-containing protein [Altibacter sp. HG106]MDC7995637.1 LytTR family DNA-binding domain-containing protein [Altibacter sp. HG106]